MRPIKERRKYMRYDTEVKVCFRVNYSLKTKVEFQVEKGSKKILPKKYPALSRNVSAEGLGFGCDKLLKKGQKLYLELFLPRQNKPICMEGIVRWTKPDHVAKYDVGVKLVTILGRPIAKTVHFDKENGVVWSAALEAIFGSFRKMMFKHK